MTADIVPSVVDRIKLTMVALNMPCAIEILDATVRRLERGEMTCAGSDRRVAQRCAPPAPMPLPACSTSAAWARRSRASRGASSISRSTMYRRSPCR